MSLECDYEDFLTFLHLLTQRFPIGGERVTCHGLKLTNSLERIKLANSLGKQQLELWTVGNLCTSQPNVKNSLKKDNVTNWR